MMVRHGETWGHGQTISQLCLISVSLHHLVLAPLSWLLSPGSSLLAPLSLLALCVPLPAWQVWPPGISYSDPLGKNPLRKIVYKHKIKWVQSEWVERRQVRSHMKHFLPSLSLSLCLSLSCSKDKCSIPTRCMWVKWVGRRVLIT